MVKQIAFGGNRFTQLRHIKDGMKNDEIALGGNQKLKIYGTLSCASGKRMQAENRVFFKDEEEAIAFGFRPCGHCLREKYVLWKSAGRSN